MEQLALPRTDPKRFGIGPRDMPEEPHARIRSPFLDQPGQEGKVIVLNEHARLVNTFKLAERDPRKLLVHRLIVSPILGSKDGPGVGDMAEGPQPLVGKAIVVDLLFLLRQPDPPEGVLRGCCWD